MCFVFSHSHSALSWTALDVLAPSALANAKGVAMKLKGPAAVVAALAATTIFSGALVAVSCRVECLFLYVPDIVLGQRRWLSILRVPTDGWKAGAIGMACFTFLTVQNNLFVCFE